MAKAPIDSESELAAAAEDADEVEAVSSAAGTVITKNANLQKALEKWVHMVDAALKEEAGSRRREVAIQVFVRTFVPADVEEEDIVHFSNNLISDEVRRVHFRWYVDEQLGYLAGIFRIPSARPELLRDRRISGKDRRKSN
jgi:hypothetical protein